MLKILNDDGEEEDRGEVPEIKETTEDIGLRLSIKAKFNRGEFEREMLSNNIQLIRQFLGLSLHEYGLHVGATKAMITSYEKGKALPKWVTIERIAALINMPIDKMYSTHLTIEILQGIYNNKPL